MGYEISYKDLPQRAQYIESVENFINGLSKKAEAKRDEILSLGEDERRRRFMSELGFPLSDTIKKTPVTCTYELAEETADYTVRRVQLELMPGFKFYGMLFLPRAEHNKNALIMALHGGGGAPEFVGSYVMDSANYNHMVHRVLRDGVAVFAPQLLLWNSDIFGTRYDREKLNRRLIQLGGSMTALEVFCLMRCLDCFCEQPYIDAARIGVVGLSYGGMYALYTAAADTRIKATYSSCWFSDRAKHNWHDWVYFNQENEFFDTEVASLVLPRRLFIEIAKNDEAFPAADAEHELDRLDNYVRLHDLCEKLSVKIFDGKHELDTDNELLETFVQYVIAC